jgi:hypothetical protein
MSGGFDFAKRQLNSARKALGLKAEFAPAVQAPPTVDEAQRTAQGADRVARRKGVLANIFAGASASAPTVGKTKLGA